MKPIEFAAYMRARALNCWLRGREAECWYCLFCEQHWLDRAVQHWLDRGVQHWLDRGAR